MHHLFSEYVCAIYGYTTPLNKKEFRVKVGSTRRQAGTAYEAGEQRIKEQMSAANSADPYEILWVEDVSDLCETGDKHQSLSNLRQLEQSWLHARMKRMGMWVPTEKEKSEWFHDIKRENVNNVIEISKSLINERRHGVSRPNAYFMREEQQSCHDQAVTYYRAGGKQFLMNAKMRFGKTFTSYQIMKSLAVNRVLVITYKPAVDANWKEDLESHVDFENWHYHSAKTDYSNTDPITLDGSGVEILFTSFQDFNDFDKDKWQHARHYHYDLIVIDEMHYGSGTDRAKESLAQLDYDRILYVSGTPLKALMSGRFLDEEIYSWSYADEQNKRRQEELTNWETEQYRWLPPMKFHTFQVSADARKIVEAYTEEEGFTMTKMFSSDDGEKFKDESAVKLFLDQVFGIGVRKEHSPVRTFACDHMLWMMPPSVNSVNSLCKMLKNKVGDDYHIINVAADNVRRLEEVKRKIMTYPKTITVSCGRFNTGVTVEAWDAVYMLDDTRAPETYFQTIFRCQSPDSKRGKEQCAVIDFNPQRVMEMIYEFADISAKSGQSTQQAVREFLDFAPVLDHSGNKPVLIDVNSVLNYMSESGGYAERFGSSIMLNWELLDQVANKFHGIDPEKSVQVTKVIADNELEPGKNFESTDANASSPTQPDLELELRKELRQKITTMMRRLPTYLFLEEKKVDSVVDIMYHNNKQLFLETVGITVETFGELCQGFIKIDRLNRCIMAYNQVENL